MPSSGTARSWEGDWSKAPMGCSPTAIAWLLVSRRPVPAEASPDAVAAASALIEAATRLGQDTPLPPPRKPVLWETWDEDIEDDKGKISAARMRYSMHFAFHPDPDVQKERFFASRGMSLKTVRRHAREIAEGVPQGYDPRKHPWFPVPQLTQGIEGCPLCHGEGSRTEQYPVWRFTVCPCKRARQERVVSRAGLSVPPPSPAEKPVQAAPPAVPAPRPASFVGSQFVVVKGGDRFEKK